jgi:hypothetical protein
MHAPRYYFNLRHGHLQVPDPRGEECPGPKEAIEHAVVAILDLIAGESQRRNWTKWSVEIEDERHCRVAILPFTLVLNAPHPFEH